MKLHVRGLLISLFVCLTAFWAGCGKKTALVPPQDVLPAPITDLRYQLDEKGVTLLWTYPRETEKGDRLEAVQGFEILRAVVTAGEYCPGCPVPFGPPIEVPADEGGKGGTKKIGRYTESLLRAGHVYFYKVRTKAGWYVSSRASNTVSFWWDTPAMAPSGLKVAVGDNSLTLSWQPPANLLDGRPVAAPLAYQLYRGRTVEDLLPLGDPVPDTSYTDLAVANGKQYFYRVRAIREYRGTKAAGMAGPVVAGSPRDLTPPAPPFSLKVVKTAAGIKLLWGASPSADLGGYRVYRRDETSRTPSLLGKVGPEIHTFVDTGRPDDTAFRYYSVSAIDRADPPNESPLSKEVVFQTVQ